MWLHTLLSLGLMLAVQATETCNPNACNKKVDNDKSVCGSDGLTYPNRCHFEKARCQHKQLTLVRKGPCKQHRPCLEGVAYANQHPGYSFKPQCKPDGSYTASQCHPDTGFCWCVTPVGTPLPYTSVQLRSGLKHKCGKRRKSKRRSPSKKHHPKPCRHSDKSTFNGNLINLFRTEWQRDQRANFATNDSVVVNWKFSDLDENHDGKLEKNEYRDLRRMVRKVVKPKKCAKSFIRACDLNDDHVLERQEWATCLSRNLVDDGRGQNTSNTEVDVEEHTDILPSRSPPHGVLSPDGGSIGQNYDDDSAEVLEEEPANCYIDRQNALSENSLYVPECTIDGRYQKIQCYKSAGYCWCVNEDTGKNIPGTSVKNDTPKCDHLVPPIRPMKGCPEDKKNIFLQELIQYLQLHMSNSTGGNELLWKVSKEEQTAKYSFAWFDKNKNKMLDRNEWKAFKEKMITVKSLKRCGKKLPRYCDMNKDRQISMTEWLYCLNIQQAPATPSSVPTVTSSRHGKKNPLSMLLED